MEVAFNADDCVNMDWKRSTPTTDGRPLSAAEQQS